MTGVDGRHRREDGIYSWPVRIGLVTATAVVSMFLAILPTAIIGGILLAVAEPMITAHHGGVAPDGIGYVVPGLVLGTLFTGAFMLAAAEFFYRGRSDRERAGNARIHLGLVCAVWLPVILLPAVSILGGSSAATIPPGTFAILVPPTVAAIGIAGSHTVAVIAAALLTLSGPVWVTTFLGAEFGGGVIGVPSAWATTMLALCALWLLRPTGRTASPPGG